MAVLPLLILACNDWSTVIDPPTMTFIASDTALFTQASGAGNASVGAPEPLTYVSLAPGSIPDGSVTEIRNRRSGIVVSTDMVDGGFDPVAIMAASGDTLDTSTLSASGRVLATTVNLVPGKRRPVVIRTLPSRNKKDVPLNARIGVVFSEPMNPASVTTGSITLRRGSVSVAGTVVLDADGTKAFFVPQAELVPAATYTLAVDATVADLDGDLLDQPASVAFMTGTEAADAVSLMILPTAISTLPYAWDFALIHAVIRDANGNELVNVPATWRVDDTTLVCLVVNQVCHKTTGSQMRADKYVVRLTGLGKPGSTIITASAAGMTDTAVVRLEMVAFSGVSVTEDFWTVCALTPESYAYCQGHGNEGQVGGAVTAWLPVRVSGDAKFRAITSGVWHTCGLALDAAVYCWGFNRYGQAGAGAAQREVWVPRRVGNGTYRQVDAGAFFTCAIDLSDAAWCWDVQPRSEYHVTPYSDSPSAFTPVAIPGGHAFAQISAGYDHACGVTTSGAAMCWGRNGEGQLGDGTFTRSSTPVAVSGGLTFAWISAGSYSTCAVTTTGDVYCWGTEGASGGYETLMPPSTAPQRVPLPTGVALKTVEVGNGPTCGVATDDSAYCWGFLWHGDLTQTGVPPAKVPGGHSFVSVSSGAGQACGATREPAVYCWVLTLEPPYVGTPWKLDGRP